MNHKCENPSCRKSFDEDDGYYIPPKDKKSLMRLCCDQECGRALLMSECPDYDGVYQVRLTEFEMKLLWQISASRNSVEMDGIFDAVRNAEKVDD